VKSSINVIVSVIYPLNSQLSRKRPQLIADYRSEDLGQESVVLDGLKKEIFGAVHFLTLSADGNHVAYIAVEKDHDGVTKASLMLDEKRGSFRAIYRHYGEPTENHPVSLLTFSPDGQRFACVVRVNRDPEKEQYVLYLDGNVVPGKHSRIGGLSGNLMFSPDGKHIAYPARDVFPAVNQLFKPPAEVMIDGRSVTPKMLSVDALAISPDGKRLAYEILTAKLNKCFVVDGKQGPCFDSVLDFKFSADCRNFTYVGYARSESYIVINRHKPISSEAHETMFSPDGDHIVWQGEGGRQMFFDLLPSPEYDKMSRAIFRKPNTLVFYGAREGTCYRCIAVASIPLPILRE